MPGLLDLPVELLATILEEVGGRELRRDRNKLLVSRKWYDAAKAVYHSGRAFTKIQEYGCTLQHREKIWWRSENERRLTHKNTQRFHLRLRGHWWDEATKRHYDDPDIDDNDSQAEANVSPFPYAITPSKDGQMLRWRDDCDAKLKASFHDLPQFEALEDFLFQVGFESEQMMKGRWHYACASAIESLLLSVPLMKNLSILTLDDYAGFRADTDSFLYPQGLCPRIRAVILYVPNVRLRLDYFCTALFRVPGHLSAEEVRLKSLVIKLRIPCHHDARERLWKGPLWCHSGQPRSKEHYYEMVQGARTFLSDLASIRGTAEEPTVSSDGNSGVELHGAEGDMNTRSERDHGMDRLRITCTPNPWVRRFPVETQSLYAIDVETEILSPSLPLRDMLTLLPTDLGPGTPPAINIHIADIISYRRLMVGEEFFVYEDEGQDCWDDEERTDLVDCGSLDVYQ